MVALKAGHGRECITPPLGIRMVGYAARTEGAAGVHDDLFVNAVALQGADETLAILAYDLCLFRLEAAAEIKSAIRKDAGLRPEQVLLNTSHTHAGPALGGPDAGPMEDDYRRTVVEKSLRALRAALADTAPSVFSAGAAPLDIGCNRREKMEDGKVWLGVNPEGPRLPEVTVWHFARSDVPDVVLLSTAMHGTTLGAENLDISGEWMGLAVQHIEAELSDVRAVFLQGCGADQNPYREERCFELVDRHGRDAAAAVKKALESKRELNPLPLRTLSRELTLPGKEDQSQTHLLPLHGVRIGDAILLGLGCEAFVEYALFGREVSGAEETLVLGYTDGNIGYLCTADAFKEGGYEPQSSKVAPESEQIAKQAIKEMLAELTADV